MNKFWKQTMALFLAFALVFGTLVPVVAWAEEPANVEEPTVESESEAPAEQPVQTAPEKKLTEEETEGKATEAPEELELSEEKTPDAQGEPASTDKPFTVTKRAYDNPSDPEEKVKDCDTLYEALEACKQEELGTLYIVTMNKNYDIPEAEHCLYTSSVNILLRSKEGEKYTLTRHGTRLVFGATKNCEFKTQNIIFDGNNDGEFTYVSEGGKLTLGDGTVVQHFIDVPNNSGPAIYLSGNPELNVDSILNIEFGAVIQNNKSENPKGSVIKLDDLQCTLNINGGTFKGNQSNYLGGVFASVVKFLYALESVILGAYSLSVSKIAPPSCLAKL